MMYMYQVYSLYLQYSYLTVLPFSACPKTPVDPCDRVKFILGDLGDDTTDQETIHPVFTELEELHYDEHAHRQVMCVNNRCILSERDCGE